MAIPNKPAKFIAFDSDLGTSIAKGLWIQARDMLDYINASYPVGMLMFFYGSQANLPATPDPEFWKFLDGTPIVNANSPLNGITVPDFRGIMVRHPLPGETPGTLVGNSTVDISHDHGGNTGYTNNAGPRNVDGGDPFWPQAGFHRHSLAMSFIVVPTVPLCYELQVYMRIK